MVPYLGDCEIDGVVDRYARASTGEQDRLCIQGRDKSRIAAWLSRWSRPGPARHRCSAWPRSDLLSLVGAGRGFPLYPVSTMACAATSVSNGLMPLEVGRVWLAVSQLGTAGRWVGSRLGIRIEVTAGGLRASSGSSAGVRRIGAICGHRRPTSGRGVWVQHPNRTAPHRDYGAIEVFKQPPWGSCPCWGSTRSTAGQDRHMVAGGRCPLLGPRIIEPYCRIGQSNPIGYRVKPELAATRVC